MALLRHPRTTPPDGFRFCQRETESRFTAETLGELADMVIEHRRYKGLTPTDKPAVELEIQRQICEGQFPGVCHAENGEDYRPLVDQSRSLNPDKVVEFSKAMYRFVESGGEIVPKAESERRARICRGCQYNRPSACVCTPLYKLLDALVPASRREPGMLVCGICGCANTVKVLMPMGTIQGEQANKKLTYPHYCWIGEKTDGEEKAT